MSGSRSTHRLLASVGSMFAALGVRNYRIYFGVQVMSLTGSWMQSIAQAWLVLRLSGDPLALSTTVVLQTLPVLLLVSYGGLIADRSDKRRLLLVTQSVSACLALGLAALTLSGFVRVWMIFCFALASGFVSVFDNPARQSFVGEMVGPKHLANAVGLNSAMFTVARSLGPAVAGITIALAGTGFCFLANGISYIPVLIGLLLMRPTELVRRPPIPRARGQIMEGIRYARSTPAMLVPIVVLFVVGLFGFNFNVMLPLVAETVFHASSSAFGLVMSALGIGAICGALFTAQRQRPTMGLLLGSGMAFGVAITMSAVMPTLASELAALVMVGILMVVFQATGNALIQLGSSLEMRGRMMALYLTAFSGSAPLGSLLVGWVSQRSDTRIAMAVAGSVSFGFTLAVACYHRLVKQDPAMAVSPLLSEIERQMSGEPDRVVAVSK